MYMYGVSPKTGASMFIYICNYIDMCELVPKQEHAPYGQINAGYFVIPRGGSLDRLEPCSTLAFDTES